MLLLALMPLLFTLAESRIREPTTSNYTVTDEAWFEVEIKDYPEKGDVYSGKFTVSLFGDTAPITVLNFVAITQGYRQGINKLHYKGTLVHRVVPDFIIQMGDVTNGDGTGGRSIYAPKFNDEAFTLSHRGPGWVAMANHGPDTNGSQFFILLAKARWLNGKHVVFGKVTKGYDVVKVMGDQEADIKTANPKKKITLIDCGLNKIEKKYELKEEELDTTDDI